MSEQYALLLTDVVDSTELTARIGDAAMSALWAEHDRVSRDLLRRWQGREIDKSDGFLLLFGCTSDAVAYAVAYHQELSALSTRMKARAGIHTGPVTMRKATGEDIALGGKPLEVDGLAKPLAARVMSLAMGGQTLLTAEARSSLGETSLRSLSHGHWRIKGFDEPIEIFEVGAADAPFEPPPDSAKVYRVVRSGDLWLPVYELRHSLPAERNPFIGRRAMLQELARRFDGGARLVSVLGTAGMGKTRLAQRFGWAWMGDFPGGVWFCDLSQARGVDGIVHAVAQGLGLSLSNSNPIDQVARAVAGRGRSLVILDNFEQVARHAEPTVGQWLDRAREARFIVTTREVLGIAGEEALVLTPLQPEEGAQLFMQRATAARHGFDPTAQDRVSIEPLVRLLDGLPLAIELAAARVPVMPPRVLLLRMSERFKTLANRNPRGGRQATLRSAFDWSWDLLSTPDKAALAQLSVFEGGFDLPAADSLLDLSEFDNPPWAVDVVQSLVEKSLVRQVSDHRFDLIGTVQDYATEQLGAVGRFAGSGQAARDAAHARHWRYFAAFDERDAVADGGIEIDNLVAACRRATAAGDSRSASEALLGAWAVLRLRGPFRVAVDLAAVVKGMPGLDPSVSAAIEWAAGSALHAMGRTAGARARLDGGLVLARAACDRRNEARLLYALSEPLSADGLTNEALTHLNQALSLAIEVQDRVLQCKVLNGLGAWHDEQASLEEARAHYEAALILSRELCDRSLEGGLLGNIGGLHHAQGRLEEARESYERAMALAQDAGDRRWEGNARCNIGLLDHDQGRPDEARAQFETALGMAREMGHPHLECTVLCNLGIVMESAGDQGGACRHYETAVSVARDLGDRRLEGQVLGYLGLIYARLGRFPESRECLNAGEALLAALLDRISLALLHCGQAEAESLEGDPMAARRALDRALHLAAETGAGADSELGQALSRAGRLVVSAQ